jgi:hypothetical protein
MEMSGQNQTLGQEAGWAQSPPGQGGEEKNLCPHGELSHNYQSPYWLIHNKMECMSVSMSAHTLEIKVKFSPLQGLEALRVVRGWGSHIF